MKDAVNDIGDWLRWFQVAVLLESRIVKVFQFKMITTTGKYGFAEVRAQGYFLLMWAHLW